MMDFAHVLSTTPVIDPYGEIRLPVTDVAARMGVSPVDIVAALKDRRLSVSMQIVPSTPILEITGRRSG